jgi:hypothetical protein
MAKMYINVAEGFEETLTAWCKDQGYNSASDFMREAMTKAMTPSTLQETVPEPAGALTPEGAAHIILEMLPKEQRDLIVDCAAEHERPVLDFILSYCKMAEERGETALLIAEGMLDDDTGRPATPGPKIVSPIGQIQPCDYCKKSFTVEKRGQKFCPDPDNGQPSCGRLSTLEELHRKRPQTLGVQHKIAAAQGIR